MRYLYTPHLHLIHEISLHTTPEKKILNNTILMLTTLLIRKYQLLISETTEQKFQEDRSEERRVGKEC